MTNERWETIERAIFVVEIALDSAMCDDGGEDDETKEQAERLLADATTLRRRLQCAFRPKMDHGGACVFGGSHVAVQS